MSLDAPFSFRMEMRAHVLRRVPDNAKGCVIAFHGYAESPERPLEAMAQAGLEDHVLVAPMAPHHFYNRNGEVVGSWMTRFERDHQVAQLLAHGALLGRMLREEHGPLPTWLLGYSQGAAHAYRLALLGSLELAGVFILAGDMPPEAIERLDETVDAPPFHLLWGADDERVPIALGKADLARLQKAGIEAELHSSPGGHDYLAGSMARVADCIRRSL